MKLYVGLLTSLIVGLALQPPLIAWLGSRGVLDIPNKRSSHIAVTPRGGGIAVVVSLGAGLLVSQVGGRDVACVFVGALILGVVGLLDDIRGLGAGLRLGFLVVVGALAGSLMSGPWPLLLAASMMAAWVAAYVNAFNFMDGINGISGLTAISSGVAYALMGLEFHSDAAVAVGASLVGAALSFLPYNIPRAKVFLGDVGSYSVGFVISALGWITWDAGAPLVLALAPTAVYLTDTGATLVRRYRRGVPLTEAHREHAYQQLTDGGLSHTAVALLVFATQTLVILTMWWAYRTGTVWLGLLVAIGTLVAYSVAPAFLTQRTRE